MHQQLALSILKSGRNVFLTGQAGAGKTYVINQYIRRLRSCDVTVAITASTGIAATHIGGVTIHSRSGIGIKDYLSDRDLELIQQKEHLHKSINKAKVLIIDEISMISANTLDMVDRVVKMIRRDGRPFGGLQLVLVGDFFQLPPIVGQDNSNKRFAFASQARKDLNLAFCYLHTQHRQHDDDFMRVLNELRKGSASDESIALLRTRLHSRISHANPVQLYTHNIDVDRINEQKLDALDTDERSYSATGKGDKKLIETIKKSMLAPEILRLKVGAQVIFVKNNPAKGYFNGTTGEVVSFQIGTQYPQVKTSHGTLITVEPEKRSIENAHEIVVTVTQIPLKLARAITVHKSQGMTLDAAEMDLSKVFEPGQGYVALSRVKSLESLKLLGLNESGLNAHPLVARGDDYFWQQSELLSQEYQDRDDQMFAQVHQRFVDLMEGKYVSESVERQKVMLSSYVSKVKKSKGSKTEKGDTLQLTLALINQGKTLVEIIQERGLVESTILSHVFNIHLLYPEVDMSQFKPDKKLLDVVKSAIKKAKKEDDTDAHPDLKTIYGILNGKVSYAQIKQCMMFL